MIYVVAGLVTAAAGVLGLAVLQEPEPQAEEVPADDVGELAGALAD